MFTRAISALVSLLFAVFYLLYAQLLAWLNPRSVAFLGACARLSSFQVARQDWTGTRRTCSHALAVAKTMDAPLVTVARLLLNRARACEGASESLAFLKQAYELLIPGTDAETRTVRAEVGLELAIRVDREGQLMEAETIYRRALEDARATLACRQLLSSALIVSAGVTALHLGKCRQAEACFRALIDPSKKNENDPHDPVVELVGPVMVAGAANNLGVLQLQRRNIDAALDCFGQGLKYARACHKLRPVFESQALLGLSQAYLRAGDIDEAERCEGRMGALKLPDYPHLSRQLETLRALLQARMMLVWGQAAESAERVRERLARMEGDRLLQLELQVHYSTALSKAGKAEQAEASFLQVLNRYEQVNPAEIPAHAEAMDAFCCALTESGRRTEADAVRQRAEEMRRRIAERDGEPDLDLHWPMPTASSLVGTTRKRLAFVSLLAAALGLLYWSEVAEEGHLYWEPGMPGVMAAGITALFCAYFLLQMKRFSLRTLMVALLLTATVGTVGHWRSQQAVQEVRFWAPVPPAQVDEVRRLIDEGLVQTLAQRGDLSATPLVITTGYAEGHRARGQLVLFLRPYRDPRVRELGTAYNAFVQDMSLLTSWPTDDPDRKVHAAEAAITWYSAVRERFGAEAALAVAHASSRIVQDPDVREVFQHIELPEYQAWTHIRPP